MLKEHDIDVGYDVLKKYGVSGLLISAYFKLNRELTSWEARGCRAIAANMTITVKKIQGKYRYHFSKPDKQTVQEANLLFLSTTLINYCHTDGSIESHPVDLYRAAYGLKNPFPEEKATQSYKEMIAHFAKHLRHKVEIVRVRGMDSLNDTKSRKLDTD